MEEPGRGGAVLPPARLRSRTMMALLLAVLAAAALVLVVSSFDDDATDGADVPTLAEARGFARQLDVFWSVELAALGRPYAPVAPGRITDGSGDVRCDGVPVEPDSDDLDGNAFVDGFCREGALVGVDLSYLAGPPLQLEMVLAHEWGHVVQAQLPEDDDAGESSPSPFHGELQADCFAGAWAGAALSASELTVAEERTAESGDESGVPRDDPDGHGTAAERVAALRHGSSGGAGACIGAALLTVLP